jgi:FkbM family methyltransferase
MPEYPETRIEFKKLLDDMSASGIEIRRIQEVLRTGNLRSLDVTSSEIILRLQSPERSFNWEPQDPRTAVTSLVVTGAYEILETSILRKIASQSNLVVDIGANIGYYAVELGMSLPDSATLIAFEPIARSFNQLVRNIELNNLKCKIITSKTAISNIDSELELFVPKVSGSSATSARNLHPREEYVIEKVKALQLDTFFRENQIGACDLIKIDVEGAELLAIKGANNVIDTFQPVIFAELLRKWSAEFEYHPNDVIQILSTKGYKCFAVSPEFPEIIQIDDETIETNFIFVAPAKLDVVSKAIDEVRNEFR